jgi:hypothetical protein
MMHSENNTNSSVPLNACPKTEAHRLEHQLNLGLVQLTGYPGFSPRDAERHTLGFDPPPASNAHFYKRAIEATVLPVGARQTVQPSARARVLDFFLARLQEIYDYGNQHAVTGHALQVSTAASQSMRSVASMLKRTASLDNAGARKDAVFLCRSGVGTVTTKEDQALLDAFCYVAAEQHGAKRTAFAVLGPSDTNQLLGLCETDQPTKRCQSEAVGGSQTSLVIVEHYDADDLRVEDESNQCTLSSQFKASAMSLHGLVSAQTYCLPVLSTVETDGCEREAFAIRLTHVFNLSGVLAQTYECDTLDEAQDAEQTPGCSRASCTLEERMSGMAHVLLMYVLTSKPLNGTAVGRALWRAVSMADNGLDDVAWDRQRGYLAADGYGSTRESFERSFIGMFVGEARDCESDLYHPGVLWHTEQGKAHERPDDGTLVPTCLKMLVISRNRQNVDMATNVNNHSAPAALYTKPAQRAAYERAYGEVSSMTHVNPELGWTEKTCVDMFKGAVVVSATVVDQESVVDVCSYLEGFAPRKIPLPSDWPVQVKSREGMRVTLTTQALGTIQAPLRNDGFVCFVPTVPFWSNDSTIDNVLVQSTLREQKAALHTSRSGACSWRSSGPAVQSVATSDVLRASAERIDARAAADMIQRAVASDEPSESLTLASVVATMLLASSAKYPTTTLDVMQRMMMRDEEPGVPSIKRQKTADDVDPPTRHTDLGHWTAAVLLNKRRMRLVSEVGGRLHAPLSTGDEMRKRAMFAAIQEAVAKHQRERSLTTDGDAEQPVTRAMAQAVAAAAVVEITRVATSEAGETSSDDASPRALLRVVLVRCVPDDAAASTTKTSEAACHLFVEVEGDTSRARCYSEKEELPHAAAAKLTIRAEHMHMETGGSADGRQQFADSVRLTASRAQS